MSLKDQINIDTWLTGDYDHKTKEEIQRLIRENPQEAVDAFYTTLSFGTGGLRGIMGVGTNRINNYTIRAATQGLANYIKKNPPYPGLQTVLIGYDSRMHSREFAEESAKVLAGNGIKAHIFTDIRPTPLVSFGCRNFRCSAAIMITASHNPPEYNGYKVYWSDGGQVSSPHDKGIIAEVNGIKDLSEIKTVPSFIDPLIHEISTELDYEYLSAIAPLQFYPEENLRYGNGLQILYTSLHGTGITLAPKTLARWGFHNLSFVDVQINPDGSFPTVPYPNPESPEALQMGIEKLLSIEADLLVANDPDADRVGIVVRHQGEPKILNGNQIACICLEHICEALSAQKKIPPNAAFIKSCVTSELFRAIARFYKTECMDVLPGFKNFSRLILEWEKDPQGKQFIFGAEESYGYLLGTASHDKDAIITSALICEVALHAKRQNKTLVDLLNDLYKKYGCYYEKVQSVEFSEGKEGQDKIHDAMTKLRKKVLTEVLGLKVNAMNDYQLSESKKADIVTYWLEDGSKVIVRPSGTEPKIKIYCGVHKDTTSNIAETMHACEKHTNNLLKFFTQHITA